MKFQFFSLIETGPKIWWISEMSDPETHNFDHFFTFLDRSVLLTSNMTFGISGQNQYQIQMWCDEVYEINHTKTPYFDSFFIFQRSSAYIYRDKNSFQI